MNTYIGIDLGTSSVKLLLVAADGTIFCSLNLSSVPSSISLAALISPRAHVSIPNINAWNIPKPKEPMKHQYDFDAATAIGFLKAHGLDKDFKMNIEANHATLAGHTFEHELRISAINGI